MAMIEVTAAALAAHPFLHGMSREHLAVLSRAASDVTVPAGHRFFEDGGHAIRFWLVESATQLWAFGAVAASPVEAFEFDARLVRTWCTSDPALGYEVHHVRTNRASNSKASTEPAATAPKAHVNGENSHDQPISSPIPMVSIGTRPSPET